MGELVVVRSGGDIATGVIQKLVRSGFSVVISEIANPSCIRRGACLSECIYDGKKTVEDITAVYVKNVYEIGEVLNQGLVPLLIDEKLENIDMLKPLAVVDAIIAKKNIGMNLDIAPITIGLGPGFSAGKDVNVVVETMRGHDLGRLIFSGYAVANTGIPGNVGGETINRVIHSETKGKIKNIKQIGDYVKKDEVIAYIDGHEVKPRINGILRGLIRDGFEVPKQGFKIADVDPRKLDKTVCYTISDKARNIGGGVLEAIMLLKRAKEYN